MRSEEHFEQVAFMMWANNWLPEECRDHLFAIPNGGKRNIGTAIKLKAEGVKRGIPDIFFDWPCRGFHGLRIEMKKSVGGQVSKEQKAMLARLNNVGYKAVVCNGRIEAEKVLKEYLLGGETK